MSTPIINVSVTGNDIPSQQYKTVILKPNLVDDVNTITQAMLDIHGANTKYVVKYDFTLGEDITVPENCVLEFEGGSISGAYTITGNHTKFNTDVAYNIFNNTLGGGFELPYIDVRWFGAVSDYNEVTGNGTDNAIFFERAITTIGQHYIGLYINLIGQYLIATPITTSYDLFIRGSHHEVNMNDNLIPTSPSLIAVESGITAFNMTGRAQDIYFINNIQLHNIKVVGKNRTSSCFIENTAAPAPGRIHVVEECSFRSLKYCLKFYTNSGDTISGDLTVSKCRTDWCDSIIYASSDSPAHRTLVNCTIKDNNLEGTSENLIHIENSASSVIIDNNIIEGLSTPIFISSVKGDISITNNYFEAIIGTCLNVSSVAQSNLIFQNNFYNENITVRFINMHVIGTLRNLTVDSCFNACLVEDSKNFNVNWIKFDVGEETTGYTSSVTFPRYTIGYEGGSAFYNYASNNTEKLVDNVPCVDIPAGQTNIGTFPGGGATQNNTHLTAAFWVSGNSSAFIYRDGDTLSSGPATVTGKDALVVIRRKTSANNNNQHILFTDGGTGQYSLLRLFVGENDIYIPSILVPHRNTTLRGLYSRKPAFDGKPEGYSYYATDKNKMIFWTGDTTKGDNGWIDANGNNPS